MPAIFEVEIQTDITRLHVIDKTAASTLEATGSQRTCLPAAHTIRTSGEIAFFKWHSRGVQVRHNGSDTNMINQTVIRNQNLVESKIHIRLGILCKRYVPKHIRTRLVLLQLGQGTYSIQEITGRFNHVLEAHVVMTRAQLLPTGVYTGITPVHDEVVRITVLQQTRFINNLRLELF